MLLKGLKMSLLIKKRWRRYFRSLPNPTLNESQQVLNALEKDLKHEQIQSIALFISMKDELDTSFWLKNWSEKYQLLLPNIEFGDIQMGLWTPNLKPGILNIPTPEIPNTPLAPDLVLVPCLGYSRLGQRLGRGKAYYDNYLSQCPADTKFWGVCGTGRLVEALPVSSHDVSVHRVYSPGQTIYL